MTNEHSFARIHTYFKLYGLVFHVTPQKAQIQQINQYHVLSPTHLTLKKCYGKELAPGDG